VLFRSSSTMPDMGQGGLVKLALSMARQRGHLDNLSAKAAISGESPSPNA